MRSSQRKLNGVTELFKKNVAAKPLSKTYSENIKISSQIDVGFGNALFISGADLLLGNWKIATRLNFNADKKIWEFKVPHDIKENEFKFLTGRFDQGESVSTAQLRWHEGENKVVETTPNKVTPQQMAAELFRQLPTSHNLCYASNDILKMGGDLLKNNLNMSRIEFDKILVGTLLLALARNDYKHLLDPAFPKHLDKEMYKLLTNKFFKPHQMALYAGNQIIKKEDILEVGKMVLEDKTFAFNGTFSQVASVQEMIEKSLPFLDKNYFDSYNLQSRDKSVLFISG